MSLFLARAPTDTQPLYVSIYVYVVFDSKAKLPFLASLPHQTA